MNPAEPDQEPAVSIRPWLVACVVAVFIATGFATVLFTGQNHHAEARLVCERFVQRRLPGVTVRFSAEKVRDLSEVRHVVTGTANIAGRAPAPYSCTVTHGGRSWALVSLTGV